MLEDLQGIEVLALIFMQTLDLHIEQRIGIDGDAALGLQVAGKIRLVLPLQLAQLPQACLIIQVGAQAGQQIEIVQIFLPDAGTDKAVQTGIGLHEPAAAGDAVTLPNFSGIRR